MSRTDPRPGQVLRDVALSEIAPRGRGQIPKIVQGTTRFPLLGTSDRYCLTSLQNRYTSSILVVASIPKINSLD